MAAHQPAGNLGDGGERDDRQPDQGSLPDDRGGQVQAADHVGPQHRLDEAGAGLRAAQENRCLDWRRDTDLERTHHCRECGAEVCREYLTDVTACDCYDQSDCRQCTNGSIICGPGKEWDWKDSRSLQCSDGSFLCGDCHQGTHEAGAAFELWTVSNGTCVLPSELYMSSTGLTLEEASAKVTKRQGWLRSLAIMHENNRLNEQLRF